ncbi:sensor histidine kinase [Curtobacterium sp. ME12]|uniref:sensor histidine kinase n=1 Tax=Curtobacterium sp. ME12 TaxID=2744253 RepID=UPI0015F5DDF7|nr:histidine kinase [Curtobacterium sp. ME12]
MRQLRMMWNAWRPDDRWVFRATAAVVLVASGIELARAISGTAPPSVAVAVVAVVCAVALCPWLPWVSLGLASVAPVLAGAAGWQPTVSWTSAVLLLFAVCSRQGHPVRAAVIVMPGVIVGTALAPGTGGGVATVLGAMISIAAAAAIGSGLRLQHQYRAVLEQRAADAIATREREAERRVAEERVRIARDLHDVVGHEVAVVSMQLGIAEMAVPADDVDTRAALQAARVGVRNVLTETQHILAVLRTSDGDPVTAPVPGTARIPELIDSYRQLGLTLTTEIDELKEPGTTVGVAVYRVLQEALTNAHRYGSGSADIRISRSSDSVAVRVENRRARDVSTGAGGSGLGLIGMRERVSAAGGTLSAGPEGMLFIVHAHFPTESDTA